MTITIGGLSTGLDTNAIIDSLLEIERQPTVRLENQKVELAASLNAVKLFDAKLDTLLTKVGVLDESRTLISRSVTASSEDFLAATASSSATAGSYEVKVGRLAQTEKVVYEGAVDRDTTSFGTGTLVIDNDDLGSPVNINIDATNNTLEGIRDAINAQTTDHGVSASIVNDGSGTPYRLVLTGKAVSNANISLDASGLSGGATFPVKDAAVSRSAQTALIQVDGISISSDTNTLTEAIPGMTLNLTQADPAFDPSAPDWSVVTATTVNVTNDTAGIQTKVEEFVTAFNDLVKEAGGSELANDSSIRSIMSALRSNFTNSAEGTGLFQLGIQTQKDGTILLDSAIFTSAIEDDLPAVESLLAGTAGSDGIADLLGSALSRFTSVTDGIMNSRQNSYDLTIRRIDSEISRNEARLELREAQLLAKFAGLETLINSLNAQGSLLTQQMDALSGGN